MESTQPQPTAGLPWHERHAQHGVAQTVERLVASAGAHGMTVFAQIDHAAGARQAGLALADMVVVVIGNPRAGTPLLQQNPRLGLDLPLRVLVWDDDGTTRITYRPVAELVPAEKREGLEETLARMADGLELVVASAL